MEGSDKDKAGKEGKSAVPEFQLAVVKCKSVCKAVCSHSSSMTSRHTQTHTHMVINLVASDCQGCLLIVEAKSGVSPTKLTERFTYTNCTTNAHTHFWLGKKTKEKTDRKKKRPRCYVSLSNTHTHTHTGWMTGPYCRYKLRLWGVCGVY